MDLEKKAIERVKTASEMSLRLYGSPLVVTDSGGKDSTVCREIVKRAGIPYEIQHNLTTADAPQTIYYVREIFRQLEQIGVPCRVNYPTYKGQQVTMWTLIPICLLYTSPGGMGDMEAGRPDGSVTEKAVGHPGSGSPQNHR